MLVLIAGSSVALAATARGGNVVMGTVLEITVVADDQNTANDLMRSAFDVARHWDDVLTTWREDGELAQLNATAGVVSPVSDDLLRAIGLMLKYSLITQGGFDPGVGPIVEGWRRGDPEPGPREGESYDIYRIRTAVSVEEGGVRMRRGAALDSGGIGKGIALDGIVRSFGNKAKAFYVDFGGSSQIAAGKPEDGAESWKVVVAGNTRGSIHGTIDLVDASLSTSRALPPSDPAGSIIDPRTLTAVRPPRLATVWAKNAIAAEAWSTALIVLGAEGVRIAEQAGVEAFVEIDGKVTKTGGFPIQPLR